MTKPYAQRTSHDPHTRRMRYTVPNFFSAFGTGTVTTSTKITDKKAARTRGVKPRDPIERARRVAAAVRDLERIGAAFTVADVAERAGVSRATIYRTPELRDLIGAKGDCARPVPPDIHERLAARHETMKAKARDLRRRLTESEQGWEEMRERAITAERRLQAAERQLAALAAQRTAATPGHGTLITVAARLGPEAMRQARRQLAAVLHPDLFAQDPAAAALATELLKSLNALTG